MTMTDTPTDLRPTSLLDLALRYEVAPTVRARDTGLWQALARRFSTDTRLIVARDRGETWAGNPYAMRRFIYPYDREARVIGELLDQYGPRHLAAPNGPINSLYVTVSKRGPAPGPNAVNVATMAPTVETIHGLIPEGNGRRVISYTFERTESYPDGLVWAHTLGGSRVPFQAAVLAGVTCTDRQLSVWLHGTGKAATVRDQDGTLFGVVMPIRHPAAEWVD